MGNAQSEIVTDTSNVFVRWLKRQSDVAILLIGVMITVGASAYWMVEYQVPKHLKAIEDGYTLNATKLDNAVKIVAESNEKNLTADREHYRALRELDEKHNQQIERLLKGKADLEVPDKNAPIVAVPK